MMQIGWIKIFILLVFLSSALIYAEEEDTYVARPYDRYKDYVNEIRVSFAEQMAKELNLLWSGDYSMMHDQVEVLGMDFKAYRRATIEEARALQLLVMDKLVQAINAHAKIQPYLEVRPFTYKRVAISISFEGINGRYRDGSVTYVSNVPDTAPAIENRNHFFYHFDDPFIEHVDDTFQEPYEEAVKLNLANPIENPAVHKNTEKEDVIDTIFASFTEKMSDEYGLQRWSIGGKMTNDIEEIGAKFMVFQPATQEEARQLLLQVTEKLLTAVNSNEKLRPYLKEYPFPASLVKMRICFRNNRYGTYRDGSMEDVTLEGDEITYFQRVRRPTEEGEDTKFVLSDTIVFGKEPYQEALKVIELTPQSTQKFKPKPTSFFDEIYAGFLSLISYIIYFAMRYLH